MPKLLRILRLWLVLGYLGALAVAQAAEPVRIGVLAFQSKSDTLAQWAPTARYLERAPDGRRFEIIPLNYEELNLAVKAASLDFVLTNPEHYVVLRNAYRVRPMVTLNTLVQGQVLDRFGSVIFARASSSIQTLADVRGTRVVAVGLYSLGGFLLAADTLRQNHIDLRSADVRQLAFTGLPHSLVVQEVLAGRADVGTVRTGVLEQMVAQGKLDPGQIRVLNEQPRDVFPQALSTELYAEWPWAALSHTDPALIKQVALALLQLPANDAAAQVGRYHGFSTPANYAPVEELMRRLKVYPGVESKPLWLELWLEYEHAIEAAGLALGLFGLGLLAWQWRSNRRLRDMTRLYRQAQSGLQVTAAAFSSQVGLIVTDEQTRIVRANQAFCEMLGYTEAQLVGLSTGQLRGVSVPQGEIRQMWHALQAQGRWQGDLVCRHAAGQDLACQVTITAIRSDQVGLSGYVGSFVDMSEQKKTETEIRQLAFYDNLTELPNRRLFLERLQGAMAAALQGRTLGALMFIDLDHFKILNDTHGHLVGDQLLQHIAQRLNALVGGEALAARLGGDEFVVMLTGLERNEAGAMARAMDMARSVHEAILLPYQLSTLGDVSEAQHTLRYNCSGSIGVTLFGLQPEPVTEVLKRADVAMYQSKHSGRNAIRQFDPAAQRLLNEQALLTADLNQALADGQLFLHYQLQTNAQGFAVGAECLLRWRHPARGLVSPVEFIPLAEESGAILSIGSWVLRGACATLAAWSRQPGFCALSLSVNVSPRQFIEDDFVASVTQALQASGARAELLTLEITEGIVLQNADQVIDKMHQLRALGVGFSIDDFGTGYSSLSYLQRLPLREVKIDKAFVNDLTHNAGSEAIVRAIIALSASMTLTVVSEGVETEAQKDQLLAMGCHLLQGYLIARPMTLDAMEALLHASPALLGAAELAVA
jgi:diguanylate cyclase (GGDEF)-like protein/PAS domain S-box-containing protein